VVTDGASGWASGGSADPGEGLAVTDTFALVSEMPHERAALAAPDVDALIGANDLSDDLAGFYDCLVNGHGLEAPRGWRDDQAFDHTQVVAGLFPAMSGLFSQSPSLSSHEMSPQPFSIGRATSDRCFTTDVTSAIENDARNSSNV
jgi:hypothetical protein